MKILKNHKQVFVAGTDTGVGKTYLACRWARYLVQKGIRVGVMKPVETGITREERSDANLLKKAACSDLPLESISPYRFKTAAAPRAASTLDKRKIRIQLILKQYHQLASDHDWMIVEGAGGFMAPIFKGFDMADLILSLNLPVILIAPEKLGTINHTLLSVHLAKSRKLNLLAIILNHRPYRSSGGHPDIRMNAKIIQENVDVPVLEYNRSSMTRGDRPFWDHLMGLPLQHLTFQKSPDARPQSRRLLRRA